MARICLRCARSQNSLLSLASLFFSEPISQSGKHGWKNTCFIPDASKLERNMFGVIEENEMGACCFGPDYNALVFSEFLELDTPFVAFAEIFRSSESAAISSKVAKSSAILHTGRSSQSKNTRLRQTGESS